MNSRTAITALALLGSLSLPASAQSPEVFTTSDLNLRAGPDPSFPVVTAIPAQQSVIFHGCLQGRSWCDVTFDGARGWAYGRYLAYQTTNVRAVIPEAPNTVEVPTVTYDTATYWDEYYQDRPFYAQRGQWLNTGPGPVDGAAAGAAAGGSVGGPVGAVVGGAVGAAAGIANTAVGVAGAAVGAVINPPLQVTQYVQSAPATAYPINGTVTIGTSLPGDVTLYDVPNYNYRYAYVNNSRVLVDPGTRQVVYIVP